MKRVFLLIGFFLSVPGSWAEGISYTTQFSLKSKYLGKLGTTVDDQTVFQPYVEINHSSGWYGYLWLNIPTAEGNPRRSLEIEPSVGYRHQLAGWTWDWSVTLFDIQNPKVLDLTGDILSPKLMVSRDNWYLEAIHYEADSGKEGHLLGAGKRWQLNDGLRLETSLSYVDGPFHFEPIAYGKLKVIWSLHRLNVDLFIENIDLLQEQNALEPRSDQIAVGISFTY